MNAPLSWAEDLNLDIPEIDVQHRRQVELLDALRQAVDEGADPATCRDRFEQFLIFTQGHFSLEEAMLRRIDYPEYDAHRAEHDKLIRQLIDLQAELDHEQQIPPLLAALMTWLKDWLTEHIRTWDHRYREAMQAS